MRTGNWELQWERDRNDRFFESILPSHRYRGALPRESTCLTIFSFVPSAFWQLASLVPCTKDELTRPLRGHPFSTRKGGDRLATLSALERVVTDCQVFRFPHVCLVRIVQDDDLRRPKAAEWSGYPLGELAAKQTEGGGMGAGNWKLQWERDRNYRFFESILPSHRCRGALPGESTCLWNISFLPGTFWQLASLVPCTKDELTRPLRGHPFSTRKGAGSPLGELAASD